MLIEQVIAVEGPVHVSEVTARLRDAWGLKRAGARIQEAVDAAIGASVGEGRVVRTEDFLSVPNRVPKVRDRSAARSPSLRRPENLTPLRTGRRSAGGSKGKLRSQRGSGNPGRVTGCRLQGYERSAARCHGKCPIGPS
ncbi:DUF3320 domain-containing protein [Acinetobacter baumannii]|uniref:DUF3320 domain-containing protein n=1 Tax=Acinetobacter baumannii TaxID=470 RepID=UPI00396C3F73